jgi:hypothetical protein
VRREVNPSSRPHTKHILLILNGVADACDRMTSYGRGGLIPSQRSERAPSCPDIGYLRGKSAKERLTLAALRGDMERTENESFHPVISQDASKAAGSGARVSLAYVHQTVAWQQVTT